MYVRQGYFYETLNLCLKASYFKIGNLMCCFQNHKTDIRIGKHVMKAIKSKMHFSFIAEKCISGTLDFVLQ